MGASERRSLEEAEVRHDVHADRRTDPLNHELGRPRILGHRSEGVSAYVSYADGNTWTKPGRFGGQGDVWTLSRRIHIRPDNTTGWQQARVTFSAGGTRKRLPAQELLDRPEVPLTR